MNVDIPTYLSFFSGIGGLELAVRLVAAAMWRSKFLRLASWRRAWKTAPWMRHLSGVTLEPSQQDSIVAAWLMGLREGWTSPALINSEDLGIWLSHSREHLRCLFSSIEIPKGSK